MLETIDLSRSVRKAEFKERIPALQEALREHQHRLWKARRPAIIVLTGWDGVGKGEIIQHLVGHLDPRGFQVHEMYEPTPEEQRYPFLRRFWLRIPAYGRLAIFSRAWYRRVLEDRVLRRCTPAEWRAAYDDINNFEQALVEDGYLILKLWCHLSKHEQEKRFAKFAKDPLASWRVDARDSGQPEKYDAYYAAAEEMLERTETAEAPWTLVSAEQQRHMVLTALELADRFFDRKLEPHDHNDSGVAGVAAPLHEGVLAHVDLDKDVDDDRYHARLPKLQVRARRLEFACHRAGLPVALVFEGWDAAGKGGVIKRLTAKLDSRGYEVVPIAAPEGEEAERHYLWRFWKHVPKTGHWTVFDRSWYGRVLVERVEGFASEAEWRRAYQEINAFERALTHHGMVLCKFWLHLSPEEQLRRFEARREKPYKRYKLTDEDWRNREKRDAYLVAADAMLHRTSTTYAPWTIVEANSKHFARLKVLETVIAAVDTALKARATPPTGAAKKRKKRRAK